MNVAGKARQLINSGMSLLNRAELQPMKATFSRLVHCAPSTGEVTDLIHTTASVAAIMIRASLINSAPVSSSGGSRSLL